MAGNEMTLDAAKAKLDAVLDQLAEAGFSVNGWDDGTIWVHKPGPEGGNAKCEPRDAEEGNS